MASRVSSSPGDGAVLSWVPWALLGGTVWAGLGVLRGASLQEFVALASGATVSLWLLLISIAELRREPPLLRTLVPTFGVSVLAFTWFGDWLVRSTHHRPLGAVTFAVLGVVFMVALLVLFSRMQLPVKWTWVPCVVALGWVAVRALGASSSSIIELGLGVVVLVLCAALAPRFRALLSSQMLIGVCSALVVLGWVYSLLIFDRDQAVTAPWILGFVQVFR